MIINNAGEIIRLFVFTLVGSLLMFVLQPLIYSAGVVRLLDIQKQELWLSDNYMSGATIVFVTSLLATFIWYVWNTYSPPADPKVSAARSVGWWILLILPILGVVSALLWAVQPASTIGRLNGTDLPVLAAMFVFDVVLVYWAATASSTPGLARRLPPGSKLLFRR
jgi:hypothetical protein